MKKVLVILLLAMVSVRGDPVGNTLTPPVMSGAGSPEGVITQPVGAMYRDTSGGAATTLYVKESGSGNTGWVAYGSPSGSGAPTTATYITQTANGSLSAEQALSLLATGFVFVTNGTGVLSSFTIESQEGALEAVMDLQDMQGAVTDAQVPDDITLTYATYEAGFEALLDLADLQGAVTDAQVPNNITIDLAATATALATARTIGGVSFDGTANIVPQTIQVLDSTASTTYPAIFESATGNQQPKTNAGLSYDSTNGVLSTLVAFSDVGNNYAAVTLGAAIEELNAVDGSGPNTGTAKVDWSQIGNMPSGFSDGTDDGGGVGGADADAIHDNVSGEIVAITDKAAPVAADHLLIEDSAASNVKKDITVGSQEAALEGVMDLADLQGNITDAQVPDTITVNQSLTGDSATAFFTTGQIERARGGTGADTSAYGVGLLGSNASNVTIDVDTVAELETSLAGANLLEPAELDTMAELNALVADGDFVATTRSITLNGTTNEISSSAGAQDLSANRTWTLSLPATLDLGGKTSFELPNAIAPTVDAFGELAGDNNLWGSGRGAPVFFDGTAAVALIGALVSDTPSDGQIPRFNTASNTITWETFSTAAGGSDTQFQYNDGGVLNGASGVTYNDATGVLSVGEMTTAQLNATAFRVLDNVDQSHALVIIANEDLASDVSLNLDLDGTTRNLRITGNSTLSGDNTGDQAGANPSASIGLSAVNGAAVTFMRSDGAPALSQAITPTWTGLHIFDANIDVGNGTTTAGVIKIYEDDSDGSNYASLSVPSLAANTVYTLPPDDGAANQVLHTDGNGVLTWDSDDGAGGGAPTDADYLVGTANGSLSAEIVAGTGVTTWFQTPSSTNFAAAITGETGTGAVVLAADPALSGNPTSATPSANDNDTSIATTAYVQTELTAYAADTVTLTNKDLTNANNTLPCEFMISCSDLTTALTTGTTKAYFRAPYAFTVTSVSASVLTAPTGSTIIVDINDSGTTIMTTNKLSIDASELTSITAATAATVTDTAIAADAVIAIDIDQVGSTIAGAGLIVTIQGTR